MSSISNTLPDSAEPRYSQRRPELASTLVISMATLITLFSAGQALARTSAVLIGVSEYAHLPRQALSGPGPDVALMRDHVLPALGVSSSDITVLADDVAGVQRPTKAAIEAEVENLIVTAAADDVAVIYFAGRGAVRTIKEQDVSTGSPTGLDALLLPADTRPGQGGPDNAIGQREVADWIDRLRGKGVFVWLICDTSYAGRVERAPASDAVAHDRTAEPGAFDTSRAALKPAGTLGAPTAMVGAGVPVLPIPEPTVGAGDYAAFFAAQLWEPTPEYEMPGMRAETHGLFTYALARVVLQNPAGSLAQYRDALVRFYASLQRHPNPVLVGTGLSKIIGSLGTAKRGWPISSKTDHLVVGAGQLQGVLPGAVLGLDGSATLTGGKLGFVKVTEARALESDAVPIEYDGLPPPNAASVANAAARPVQWSVPLALRVALSPPSSSADSIEARVVDAALLPWRSGQRSGEIRERVIWVDGTSSGAEVVLVVDKGRLWFAGADGSYVKESAEGLSESYSIRISTDIDTAADAISAALARVARVRALTRLTEKLARPSNQDLSVDGTLYLHRGHGVDAHRVNLELDTAILVEEGDEVRVALANRESQPWDVALLYADAAFGIQLIFPEQGEKSRIPGPYGVKAVEFGFDQPFGSEKLLVLAKRPQSDAPATEFSILIGSARLERQSDDDLLAQVSSLDRASVLVSADPVSSRYLAGIISFEVGRRPNIDRTMRLDLPPSSPR